MRARALVVPAQPSRAHAAHVELPLALRHGGHAVAYLASERSGDHPAAAAAATESMRAAAGDEDWWAADIWGHRALWHFERAEMTLEAVRTARWIGDVRAGAGDPDTARRYYAEAIDEARDIGAEHEQGLATLGMGRSLLQRGDVTSARRMASAALDLLQRGEAESAEIASALELLGTEISVGGGRTEVKE